MSRTLLLFFVVAVVFASGVLSDERPRCGRNEEYTTCGTACPPSCKNPRPEVCTMQCVIGCQCRRGYLRNDQGVCVKPNQCYRSG